MSISWKVWCQLWHSSHNEILTHLPKFPSSGYFKNHWSLELFLKCHRGSQNVYFFYLGPIISLNILAYFYWGSYFITRGNNIWVDFSGMRISPAGTDFEWFFFTGDDVIDNVFPKVGVRLRPWHRGLYQSMEIVDSLVSGLLTRLCLLYLSSGRFVLQLFIIMWNCFYKL